MNPHFQVKFLDSVFPAEYVTDVERASELLDAISECCPDTRFGIDTETTPLAEFKTHPKAGLSPHMARIATLQLFTGEKVFVFNLLKIGEKFNKKLIKFLSMNKFVAHYAQFDLQFFMQLGVQDMDISCTRILARLFFHAVYPTDEGLSATLEELTNSIFKERILKKLQLSDWSGELTFEQIQYAALDAVCTYNLAVKLSKALSKYGLERIYRLTKAAQAPIARMQINGFKLNVEKHKLLTQKWRNDLHEARQELVKLTGLDTFSDHKLSGWLSDNLPAETLALWPKTESGKLATDSNVFADFSYLPIVKPIAKFKKALKLTTTYGKPLIDQINPATKRLHANYNLCGARTGRLSCSTPNLQQAPRDPEFRSCFIPEAGNVLIRADFNQIEIRVAAELSQDETMLKAYRDGVDIHSLTASQVTNKNIKDVTDEDRRLAKAVNFGFMFGLGARKFAHYAKKGYGVDISSEQAFDAVDAFRTTYSGYREWQVERASESGQSMTSRTPCGKLRALNTENCYGASMNTPVQGGAAECMLYSLVLLHYSLLELPDYCRAKLVNCVHDEVIVECAKGHEEAVSKVVKACMIDGFLQVFPDGITKNLVAIDTGKNWAEAK